MDFANILFGGPCNRSCPFCIGQQLPERVRRSNLDLYPLRNQEFFISEVNRLEIPHLVFTGTTTDPLLYRHQERLLETLREKVVTGADISLHTNGVLLLKQVKTVRFYDKVCLSFPSFEPETYGCLMGTPKPPDLERIAELLGPRLKLSCVVTEENRGEIPEFLRRCRRIGIRRLVLRHLYEDPRRYPVLTEEQPERWYRGNPIYDLDGMEVTLWQFESSESTSLNLFSDGTLGRDYLLARTTQLKKPVE